jgi:hypothetical protein
LKAATIIGCAYGALGLISLALIPASAHGWFGLDPDPLSAVFAMLLAMPWSLALGRMGEMGPLLSMAGLLAGICINFAIILAVGRLFRRGPKTSSTS